MKEPLPATPTRVHMLTNGLTLLGEVMPDVGSAAFFFLLPAGGVHDPDGLSGAGAMAHEWVFRGAGARDARQLSDELDRLGLQRGGVCEPQHVAVGAVAAGQSLLPGLRLFADVLRRPRLAETEFYQVRALALQEIDSLEDEPRQKAILELIARHLPHPLGRCPLGTRKDVAAAEAAQVRLALAPILNPAGAVLAVAGALDWDAVCAEVEELFSDWPGCPVPEVPLAQRGPRAEHLPRGTAQVQIAVAYDAVPFGHPEHYCAAVAVAVLSGGMSGRLFTEVRERRGLCYAVMARHHTIADRGLVISYAGTAPDRAQETLDVLLGELRRLPEDVTEQELDRAKAGLKSHTILAAEHSRARAHRAAQEWDRLGRVRTLEEIAEGIEAVTRNELLDHLRRHPPRDFTILTIGPTALHVPE